MKDTLQTQNWIANMGRATAKAALALAAVLALAVMTISTPSAQAQTFTTLASFDGTNGSTVTAPLVQAIDGNLYGTAEQGGANGDGTLFNITTGGTLNLLYSFCSQPSCTDGSSPVAGLVQATNGYLYGITPAGGNLADGNRGTIFKYAPGTGPLTTIYDFDTYYGSLPLAGLVQASNGDLYGTTESGGTFPPPEQGEGPIPGSGTVFKITETSTLTKPTWTQLYIFCSGPAIDGGCNSNDTINSSTGWAPIAAPVQATNGILYGTNCCGGNASDSGTIYQITEDGTLTNLYDFCSQTDCADGINNYGIGIGYTSNLVQATNGNLYGITSSGGANGAGVVFEITPAGEYTTLYSFCSQTN